jgi:hypothetical protein
MALRRLIADDNKRSLEPPSLLEHDEIEVVSASGLTARRSEKASRRRPSP